VLAVIGIAAALVACIYYLRVVSALFLKEGESEAKPSITALITATLLTVLGIALGIVPDTVFNFIATL
jgi:NADH:ubiquinone oxidoreductase subunit 2 (subunit N)